METVKLNNGVEMPILGYGVYQVTPEECERCVADGHCSGVSLYRYGTKPIDNEEGCGACVKRSGVPRHELFITTKVWISNGGYEKARLSIDESLKS